MQIFHDLEDCEKNEHLIDFMLELSDPNNEDEPKERLEYDPEEEDFDPDLNDWEIVLKLQSLIAVLNY